MNIEVKKIPFRTNEKSITNMGIVNGYQYKVILTTGDKYKETSFFLDHDASKEKVQERTDEAIELLKSSL